MFAFKINNFKLQTITIIYTYILYTDDKNGGMKKTQCFKQTV